ncbi:MAG: cyclic nucleotide-binding domain-containing protein [Endomicrobiia bacterium]
MVFKKKDLSFIIGLINTYKVFKKEKVILEEEKGQDIFVVLNGRINVCFEEGKKKIVLKTLYPAGIFGEVGYFTKRRIASCVALEESIV